ncbi:MAG: hypothetical protein ABFS45_25510 [Pseudomonadota bacterium]
MDEQPDDNISIIAAEIIRYLMSHDKAADTLKGVAQWWISRQRIEESQLQVRNALELLCRQGVLKVVPLVGGELLYSLNKARDEEIRRRQ